MTEKVRNWFHSIRSKLITLIAFSISAVSVLIFLLFPPIIEDQLLKTVENKAESIATMTAYSIRAALDFSLYTDVENSFRVARQNKDIEFIVLKDVEDNVVYAFNESKAERSDYNSAKTGNRISKNQNTFLTLKKVEKDGRELGELYLGLSLTSVSEKISLIKKIIAVVCFLIIILGLIAGFAISKVVISPLQKMASTFEDISNGDLSQRAKVETRDEVGQLARSFNTMVDVLESAYKELESSNKSLYSEIMEREKISTELRKLSEAIIQSPVAITIINHQGIIEYVNPKFVEMTGYSFEEIKESPEILMSGNTGEAFFNELWRTINSGEVWKGEINNIRKDGTEYWVFASISPVYNAEGTITHFVAVQEDVTKRKLIEETRKKYEFIVNTSKEFMTLISRDYIYEAVNESYCRALNRTREQIVGKSMAEIWGEEKFRTTIKDHIDQCFSGKEVMMQSQFNFGALDERYIDIHYYPFYSENGEITHSAVVSTDITERKIAENILRESEERYRELVSELPDFVVVHQQGKIIFVNHVVTDLLGYHPSEVLGHHILEYIADDYKEKVIENTTRRLKGESVPDYEIELLTKSGERIVVETRGAIITYDNKPATLNVLTNVTERKKFEVALQKANEELEMRVAERTTELVSAIEQLQKQIVERKQAEESLRESEEKFRALAEYSSDGIMRFDRELRHLYVNKATEKSSGIPASQFLGKTHKDLGFPENLISLWNSTIATVFDTKEPSRIEFEYNKSWIDWSVCPEFDPSGNVKSVLTSARDITERKKNEQELISAREQALEASRLKSEFLANMSHEIRTPLNGIIGMTNLLLGTPLNPDQQEFINIIRNSGDALLGIINDILDFSKIEAGMLELEIIEFNIRNVVEEAVELFSQRAHEKKIELLSIVYNEVPSVLKGDPGRLRQVLINLIGNAVKFTHEGEVVLRVKVYKKLENKFLLYFSVTDTGIGLSTENQSRLFRPFTQADGSTTRKYGGTGLGLSISKRITEMMNGEIGVDSELRKGSTFWFTAEFELSDKEPLTSESETIAGFRVLIIDDNSTNLKIIQHQTSSFGMRTATVDDADRVINILLEAVNINDPFHVVILDQHMRGLELVQEINSLRELKDLKIVMLTSLGEMNRDQLQSYGITCYLSKPVKQSSLYDVLSNCLGVSSILKRANGGEKENAAGYHKLGNLRVLIAEDNTTNQKVAMHMLKNLGVKHIDIVANGLEVLSVLKNVQYDLIFMDCQMPELDGFETTKQIRKIEGSKRHTGIVAMTANALQGDRDKCFAVGMDDYIPKPINPKLLEAILLKQVSQVKVSVTAAGEVPESDTEINLIDLNQISILIKLGGDDDPALINQFIETYFEDSPAIIQKIGQSIKDKDAKELKASAHKLKGASGNIGASYMQKLCLALENAAKENNLTEAETLYKELLTSYDKTKQELSRFMV